MSETTIWNLLNVFANYQTASLLQLLDMKIAIGKSQICSAGFPVCFVRDALQWFRQEISTNFMLPGKRKGHVKHSNHQTADMAFQNVKFADSCFVLSCELVLESCMIGNSLLTMKRKGNTHCSLTDLDRCVCWLKIYWFHPVESY